MRFGICTSLRRSAEVKAAGWDYVEENVKNFFQGLLPDDQWVARRWLDDAVLGVPAASSMVPADLKTTGPNVNPQALHDYMAQVLQRADIVGCRHMVFGSGPSRNVEPGVERDLARRQIIEFLRDIAPMAARHGVTMVVEPLNTGETNIINSIAEAMTYVAEINHPNIQCLLDTFHMWFDKEPLENLRAAMPWIKHVHLADLEDRMPPGESGKDDYRPVFRILKEGNYQGTISIEPNNFNDYAGVGTRVLKFLKKQWEEA